MRGSASSFCRIFPEKSAGRLHERVALLLFLPLALALVSCGYARRLFPIQCSEGYGYIDQRGQVAIKPAFPEASTFSEGRAAFFDGSGWGYLDQSGKEIIPPVFEWAGVFSEGLAPVRMAGRYGYIDRSGELVVEARYELADEFHEGLAVVRREGRFGYIDRSGFETVEMRWVWAGRFSNGLALALGEDSFGYIDHCGELRIRLPLPASLSGAGDEDGFEEEISPLKETPDIEEWQSRLHYHSFSEGLAPYEKEGKIGYIDREGQEVIEPRFQAGESFNEGLAAVKQDGRWGYIDREGAWVIEPAWQQAGPFSDGLAPVMDQGIWGYLDRGGSLVIVPAFDSAGSFREGIAVVSIGDVWGYIDRKGNYLWVPTGPLTPFKVSSPPRLPLYLMDAALLICLGLLFWGIAGYLRMLRSLWAGGDQRVLDAFLERYHSVRRMRRIRKGPFILSDHLERMKKHGKVYLFLTASFLTLLWFPNLLFLALTGRGMINHLLFHRNAFPGDDALYLALGSLVLAALIAHLSLQNHLISGLLRRMRDAPPVGEPSLDPAPRDEPLSHTLQVPGRR